MARVYRLSMGQLTVKKLKELKKPPSWLDLENYAICSELSPAQWADELEERIRRRNAVAFFKDICTDPHLPDGLLSRIIAPPSGDLKWGAETVPTSSTAPGAAALNLHGCVRPLLFSDIAKDLYFNDFEALDKNAGDKRYDEVIEGSELYVVVDPTATDSALVAAMLDFVKKIRLIKGIRHPTKGGTESSIAKIRQYRVLPYLDLLNWAKLTGNRLPAPVIADALFPTDPTKDEKFVRDTLAGWAEAALQPGFIANLRELAVQ